LCELSFIVSHDWEFAYLLPTLTCGDYTLHVEVPSGICELKALNQTFSSHITCIFLLFKDGQLSKKDRRLLGRRRRPNVLYNDENAFRNKMGLHLTHHDCLMAIFNKLLVNAKRVR
jgi:hypothetical protein